MMIDCIRKHSTANDGLRAIAISGIRLLSTAFGLLCAGAACAELDFSALQFSTSAASAGRRIELRAEGTVGHALVGGTEWKGEPDGSASSTWDTTTLATGWQTLMSGTNAAAILKLDPQSTAIEGGRLQLNTTWSNAKTHVVRNWVVVPDGVTLTISQGVIVKFCESTGITVLSGGKVQINGAEGADVFFASIGNDTYSGDTNMRAGDFATNAYEIVTLNGGTWSDNGYWVTPDAALRPYPTVELHDAIGAVEGGIIRVPVTVEGTRNAPFSIDWAVATTSSSSHPFLTTSGTLSWSQSSEGTKFIELPVRAGYSPDGTETFSLSATRARSVNLANEVALVMVYSGHIAVGDVIENGESGPSAGTEIETRGIGGTMIAKALERISYSPRWSGASECSIALDGNRLLSTAESGSLSWTRPSKPGLYTFTHKAGAETMTARFAVLGDDTTAIDSNRLQSNATWTADKIWLITGSVTVSSGVTLTIEPGAVVKFMPGAKLVVEAGGTCVAKGVKFTHAYDDAVGGDTLFDGATTLPVMEDYEIKGTVTDDDSTEYRYTAPIVLSGTITVDTTWRGWKVYNVSGNLTIQSGKTLTIEPGAVVKFNSSVSLTVSSGATLNAIGTRAQPIVFTSIKDDEFGGDTNKDLDKTYPENGDWDEIRNNGGTLRLTYVKALYGGYGQYSNQGDAIVRTSGGTTTLTDCELKHSNLRLLGKSEGSVTASNCVFEDGRWGSDGSSVLVNCVVSDCTIGATGGTLQNTVFYNCLNGTGGGTYRNCLFFNPVGFGPQYYSQVGSNGNIWGDPKFVDAENGDFRIQKGSACVNAGDAANAPEYDYYGQPRDDGAPDIGIHELAGAMSANDLAIWSAAILAADSGAAAGTAALHIGDTLAISYAVANVGKQAINGSWRDKVSLVSPNGGYAIDLGTIVQTAAIAVGATNTFNAAFTIPTDAEGTWRVAVNVNTERDIYEGANVTNNAATSAESLSITLPERDVADGFSGTATKGSPAAAKFALPGAEPMVARINAPAGTVVYFGSGFMPSASSYSARAVVGTNGGLIGIPEGVTEAYLLVETASAKGVAFTMTLESTALAIQSVSPATLPYTGTTGLVIDGANFAEGCRVELTTAGGSPSSATAATLVSPTRMTAQIDCSRLTAGATYSVKVIGADGATATLPNAVTVANVPAEPKLKATLDAPASVRRGRTLTVYIDYENIGNADMPAPVFELISEGQVFKIDGAGYTNSVKVMGLSSEAPVGTLRPDEPQRLGIQVTILAENVKWKLRSHHAAQEGAKKTFSLRLFYNDEAVLYHDEGDADLWASVRKKFGSTWAEFYGNLGFRVDAMRSWGILTTSDYETVSRQFAQIVLYEALAERNAGSVAAASAISGHGTTGLASVSTQASPKSGCNHVFTSSQWQGTANGSLWMLCPTCKDWCLLLQDQGAHNYFDVEGAPTPSANAETFIICHGNKDSIDIVGSAWVRSMGVALLSKNPGANVLAINWGKAAEADTSEEAGLSQVKRTALRIPAVAAEAARQFGPKGLGLDPGKTTLIGHSHGGHVIGHMATSIGGFKRVVGLDTSTAYVHPSANLQWMDHIRGSADQVDLYRSSWWMSFWRQNELYGDWNFAVFRKGDCFFLSPNDDEETGPRHQHAYKWFIDSIEKGWNVGYGFMGRTTWETLCGGTDIPAPGASKWAGMIRDDRVELLSGIRNGRSPWKYQKAVLDKANESSGPSTSYAMGKMCEAMTRSVDVETRVVSLPDEIRSGDDVEVVTANLGDNMTVSSHFVAAAAVDGQEGPWSSCNGVWLIDLQGLKEVASGESWESMDWTSLTNAVRIHGLSLDDYMKIVAESENNGSRSLAWLMEGNRSPLIWAGSPKFANSVFGKDRLLVTKDENGNTSEREVLLAVGTCLELSGAWWHFGFGNKLPGDYAGELYPANNIALKKVRAIPKELVAVISKSASNRKAASHKSVRLMASPPTHELSENALKPGEVVDVYANSNGVWSISLNCTESYTTVDEDEIVFNRFELTDAGNEDGAPRFQNNNAICDVERVTVSGTLPKTTDADGNLVCEGRRYTVQLTVASGDNEDDVTTCILDVRYDPDHDPGEDEDEDDSDEPKSCDPNEMVGDEGVGEKRLVNPGQTLTYTIYFENKSDADAAAACVEVVNPLNKWLDWSSLTMLDVGFNNHVDSGLDGKHEGSSEKALEGTNVSVRTEFKVAYFDAAGNEVKSDGEDAVATSAQAQWYLRIIDPNGDAEGWPLDMTGGFLPPNDDTHRGEGYIRYSIRVRDDAPGNVVITNSATIIFDKFNAPIVTDPAWWNTVATIYKPTIDLGDGTTAKLTLIVGQPYGDALPAAPAKAKVGHSFGGWFTGPNGTGRRITAKSLVQAGDTRVYALWRANTYKVRFNANGGSGKMADQSLTYGVASKLTANAFTRPGFTFSGWAKSARGGAAYPNRATVKNLTSANGATVTLYAVWKAGPRPSTYTVSFNANGGKGKMAAQTMTYGKAAALSKSAFTRKDYVFIGWATARNGKVAYMDGASVKNLIAAGKTATLYALWAKEKYKVAFYGTYKGVKGKMAKQTMTYGKAKKLSKNKFKRKGYVFKGWAKSKKLAKKGKVAYKNRKKVKNLVTNGKTVKLYAVWKKK